MPVGWPDGRRPSISTIAGGADSGGRHCPIARGARQGGP